MNRPSVCYDFALIPFVNFSEEERSSILNRVNLLLAREATSDECSSSNKSGSGITDDKPPSRPFSCKVEVIRRAVLSIINSTSPKRLIVFPQ